MVTTTSEPEKKSFFNSYLFGIRDKNGASFKTILGFFTPEFATSFLLYFLPLVIDYYFIGCLESKSAFASFGVTTSLLHVLTKVAEGLSVGVVVVGGQYNGAHEYKKVGRTVVDAFWLSIMVGAIFFLLLFFEASTIYSWYGVTSPKMIRLGVPYLQLRAIGMFFTFIYFIFVGFLRSIKKPQVPMIIYAAGSVLFVILDWVLIFGKCGFAARGMQGSALASVIQMIFMLVLIVGYIFSNPQYRKYAISLSQGVTNFAAVHQLIRLSWPIIIDKATFALAYLWLGRMLAPSGKIVMASFTVIRHMEGFAILPAVALSQVVTFMVSNDVGAGDWTAIKSNVKKILFLAMIMVVSLLVLLSSNPSWLIKFFDPKGSFTQFSAYVFPLLNMFVIFDLLQLIFSGALRGAANVNVVMWVRVVALFGFFVPLSYGFSLLEQVEATTRFLLIYGTFYVAAGLMTILFIRQFRSGAWKSHVIPQERV